MFASNAWHPRMLFGAGEPGLALDLTHSKYLYQDSARSTLVNVAGDPIGSPTDISGNGNHPTQVTAASRPIWDGERAVLDGVDDGWVTPIIDFTSTDEVTVIASIRKLSDAAPGVLMELGPGSTSTRAFRMFAPGSLDPRVDFGSRGDNNNAVASYIDASVAAPITLLLEGRGKISIDLCSLLVNGVEVATSPTDQGGNTYRPDVLNIGRRNNFSVPFNGWLYRLIVVGRLLTAPESAKARAWAAKPAGVVLA